MFVTTFSLTRVQTNGATDWEFFTMGKEAYLVVANAYNYGSQNYLDIDNYATNSTIYKLNTVKRVFEKYQSIPTYRCVAVRCGFETAVRTGSYVNVLPCSVRTHVNVCLCSCLSE